MDSYIDPVLLLARDPDLNREKGKTTELILMIHGFPPSERRILKLCQLLLTILQTLEKLELQTKNWQFILLDVNSDSHFDEGNDKKSFNFEISGKVLDRCQEIQKSLYRISQDLDHITRALKLLTPLEYILDLGCLLTQLTLRNIKLKDSLTDSITIAYSRARLITIGYDLETVLLEDGDDETMISYQKFVAGLLKQLNLAIDNEDIQEKHECMAVISDVEKMYNSFREQRLQEWAQTQTETIERREMEAYETTTPELNRKSPTEAIFDEDINDFDSEYGSHSVSSVYSQAPPMVQSITRSTKKRRDSDASLNASLHKTTIAEEMPYLMSAFNLARNFEEDVSHYMDPHRANPEVEGLEVSGTLHGDAELSDLVSSVFSVAAQQSGSGPTTPGTESVLSLAGSEIMSSSMFGSGTKKQPVTTNHLPNTSLYHESTIRAPLSTPSSYLYANNSLLSKLGIRPQVITTDIRPPMGNNTSLNKGASYVHHLSSKSVKKPADGARYLTRSYYAGMIESEGRKGSIDLLDSDSEDNEENEFAHKNMVTSLPSLRGITPLTLENLASFENEIE